MPELTKAELADLIEKGLATPGVQEYKSSFFRWSDDGSTVLACAEGLALVGLIGDPEKAIKIYEESGQNGSFTLARLLNFPDHEYLMMNVGTAHHTGELAKNIAERLRKEHQEENGS